MQGARLADDRSNTGEEENEKSEPPPAQEEQVKLTAPSRKDEAIKEEPLSPPIRYDEWDYVIGRERPSWCTLLEKPAPEGDPHSVDEIHDCMVRLWTDDKLCATLAERGRQHARDWGPPQFSNRLRDVIDALT